MTIEYDAGAYAETNGYHGTYLDLYLAEFEESLQDYLNRLPYASDWTWFDKSGNALSDSDVAAMSASDKAQAFVEGRYAKGSTSSSSGNMGAGPGGAPSGMSGGSAPSGSGPSGSGPGNSSSSSTEEVGTPDAGTTQSANGTTDSSNYGSFSEMLAAYQSDIASIQAGDAYGNNIVELYDPTKYIGAQGTANPTWARVLMGASEGDISMLNSLNLEIAWLNAGTDASIEWQWDGGHVPSEILGDSAADARHWDKYVLKVFEENQEALESLFNAD